MANPVRSRTDPYGSVQTRTGPYGSVQTRTAPYGPVRTRVPMWHRMFDIMAAARHTAACGHAWAVGGGVRCYCVCLDHSITQ